MFRSSMNLLVLRQKLFERSSFLLQKRSKFATNETAKRVTKDAGQYAQDSSKVLYRLLDELSTSNEVKLVRLSAVKAYEHGKMLFYKHVLNNTRFQSFLASFKAKLDQITVAPDVKAKLAEKIEPKKIDQGPGKGNA